MKLVSFCRKNCVALCIIFIACDAVASPYDVEAKGYLEVFPTTDTPYDTWIGGSNTGTGALVQPSYNYNVDWSGTSGQDVHSAVASGTVAVGNITFASQASSTGTGGYGRVNLGYLDWADTLTVLSSTLAPGTPVVIGFKLVSSGSLGVSGDNNSSAHIQDPSSADIAISMSIGLAGVNVPTFEGGILDGTVFGGSSNFPSVNYTGTGVASVGNSFSLASGVESFVEASASSVSPSVNSFLNGSVQVYVEALTPGAQLVSASGWNYAPPAVPVPAASWSFGSALLALVSAHRRRSTHMQVP